MESSAPPPATRVVSTRVQEFDGHHLVIVIVFMLGAFVGGYPAFVNLFPSAHPIPLPPAQILTAVCLLLGAGVGAWRKTPPGGLLEVFEEGETEGEKASAQAMSVTPVAGSATGTTGQSATLQAKKKGSP